VHTPFLESPFPLINGAMVSVVCWGLGTNKGFSKDAGKEIMRHDVAMNLG
jgi:hypothetical protein